MIRLLILLALCGTMLAQDVTVLILNDSGTEFRGYLTVMSTGTPVVRGSLLGITVPGGEYEWQIPIILSPAASLRANFGPEITCSVPFQPGTRTVFNLHFLKKTATRYGCSLQ